MRSLVFISSVMVIMSSCGMDNIPRGLRNQKSYDALQQKYLKSQRDNQRNEKENKWLSNDVVDLKERLKLAEKEIKKLKKENLFGQRKVHEFKSIMDERDKQEAKYVRLLDEKKDKCKKLCNRVLDLQKEIKEKERDKEKTSQILGKKISNLEDKLQKTEKYNEQLEFQFGLFIQEQLIHGSAKSLSVEEGFSGGNENLSKAGASFVDTVVVDEDFIQNNLLDNVEVQGVSLQDELDQSSTLNQSHVQFDLPNDPENEQRSFSDASELIVLDTVSSSGEEESLSDPVTDGILEPKPESVILSSNFSQTFLSMDETADLSDWGPFRIEQTILDGKGVLYEKATSSKIIKSIFEGGMLKLRDKGDVVEFGWKDGYRSRFELTGNLASEFCIKREDFMYKTWTYFLRPRFIISSSFRNIDDAIIFSDEYIYKGRANVFMRLPQGHGTMLKSTGEVLRGEFDQGQYVAKASVPTEEISSIDR